MTGVLMYDKDRDWSYAAVSQGMPKIASKPPETKKERKDSPTGFRRKWPGQHLDFILLAPFYCPKRP